MDDQHEEANPGKVNCGGVFWSPNTLCVFTTLSLLLPICWLRRKFVSCVYELEGSVCGVNEPGVSDRTVL